MGARENRAPSLTGIGAIMINEISQTVVAGTSPSPKGSSDSVSRLQVQSTEKTSNATHAEKSKRVETGLAPKQLQGVETEEIKKAVDDLNDFAQAVHRQLEFSVDEDSGKTVVKVIDVDTGETIRDIPPEEIRNMQKHMKEMSDRLFDAKDSGISLLFKGEA